MKRNDREHEKDRDRERGASWWGLTAEGGKRGVSTLRQLSCLKQSVRDVASPRAFRDL